jgi:LuxR family maltose regulon positive regulatory protein
MVLAKTSRPTSFAVLARPRLFKHLDRLLHQPVTWIWSPPGAGKTILVASYIATRKYNHLWYQLDEGDSDLSSFFYFLGRATPKRRRPMPLLTPEFRQNVPIFIRNFFRELYDRLKPPFLMVFDNYQDLPVESDLNQLMPLMLAELPPKGHVIFISRDEPPPGFARLRAERAMETLEYAELRFTEREAVELIRKSLPGKLSKSKSVELYRKTDGWAAGLVLSLEQTRHQSEKPASSAESSQVLFDYFAGEVFKRADRQTQELLCQAAFFPRVTASMAEQQSGFPTAGQIIARLHRQNLFTTRLPGTEPTYEFHPLFREFLLMRGKKLFSPGQVKEIRRRSAHILEQAGQVETAALALRDAEAWQELTDLICRHAPAFIAQGRIETLEQWIGSFPDSWVDQTPWLLLWRGVCRAAHFDQSLPRDCEDALSAFRSQRDAAGAYLAWATIVTRFVVQGAHDRLPPWNAVFDELRVEFPQIPNLAIESRVAEAAAETLISYQLDREDLEYWVKRSVELARQQNDLPLQALSALTWWRYYWVVGDHFKAGLVIDAAAKLMNDAATPPFTAVVAGLPVAMNQYLRADPGCRDTIAELLRRGEQLGFPPSFRNLAITVGLASALSDGDVTSTGRWLDENKQFLESPVPGQRFHSLWTLIWAALIRDDIDLLEFYSGELLNLKRNQLYQFFCWLGDILLAKCFHRLGEPEHSKAELNDAFACVASCPSPYMEFTTRLTQAEILFDYGQETEGLETLRIAMALGKAGSYVTSEIWIPAVMARLCAKALEAGIEVDYVRMLVRKRNLMLEEPPVDIEAWPWPIRIYTLAQFQILKNDQPLTFSHKVQKRPLALLKAIIAFGGNHVREEALLDLLWPDADGDAAAFALTTAVHRLRKLLGNEQAITRQDNKISLNRRCCWVDVWAVERLLERSKSLISGNGDEQHWVKATELLDSATKLFKDPFLNADPDLASSPVSDGIRRGLLRQFSQLGHHWEWKNNFERAAILYEQALAIDPCAEDICRKLMSVYHKLGRPGEPIAIYNTLKDALKNRLELHPSAETEATLKRLTGR